jgi:ribosome recycling factor
MDVLKKMKAAKELSEDMIADCEAEVEKFISATMTKVEGIIAAKEKELLTV